MLRLPVELVLEGVLHVSLLLIEHVCFVSWIAGTPWSVIVLAAVGWVVYVLVHTNHHFGVRSFYQHCARAWGKPHVMLDESSQGLTYRDCIENKRCFQTTAMSRY